MFKDLKELKTTPTNILVDYLSEAYQKGEQGLVNIYAYELATRIYIPNKETSFDDMLKDFGYKEPEQKVLEHKIK